MMPITIPTAAAASIASGTLWVAAPTTTAVQAHSPSEEPIERSKVPEMMATVMPTAATPTKELWRSTLSMLSGKLNFGTRK